MRAVSMLPLAFSAVLLAACGTESLKSAGEETASSGADRAESADRDLTLQAQSTPAVEVASAVELSRPSAEPGPAPRPKISRKPAPVPAPDPAPEASPAAEAAAPVPSVAVAEVLAEPAPEEDATAGARELAPGKTVTIVPASAGPSSAAPEEPGWESVRPARGIHIGGGGDRCRPRGGGHGGVRGIGIAGRIPIGVPRSRLR